MREERQSVKMNREAMNLKDSAIECACDEMKHDKQTNIKEKMF